MTLNDTNETGWESAYYTYSSSQSHTVSNVQIGVATDEFEYDLAGNMTSRKESGTSWTQTFDEEGRLVEISDGSDAWEFVYDGDGARVMQENPDGTTTLFLGGGSHDVHIDGETTTVKKYYAVGGQRVMRDVDGLHYLLTDHLGSVVGVLDSNGDLETDERYLPFGELRDKSGITETDFAFTGQRNLSDVGLMDYNARWYSPSLGRFISPDTIVPEPSNPQALNRCAYTNHNPLRYTDPSGHFCVEVGGNVICSEDDDDSNMYWWPSVYKYTDFINTKNWGQRSKKSRLDEVVKALKNVEVAEHWWQGPEIPEPLGWAPWLLYEEGSILYPGHQEILAQIILYKLNRTGFEGFTPMINPKIHTYYERQNFTPGDWQEITNPPGFNYEYYNNIINKVMSDSAYDIEEKPYYLYWASTTEPLPEAVDENKFRFEYQKVATYQTNVYFFFFVAREDFMCMTSGGSYCP